MDHLYSITLQLSKFQGSQIKQKKNCGERYYITFKENECTLDRSEAGRTDFPNFVK